MKKYMVLIVAGYMASWAWAQPDIDPSLADSLKQALEQAPDDTSRVLILDQLTRCYTATNLQVAEAYGQQGRALAEKIGYRDGRLLCALSLGFIKLRTYGHAKALRLLFSAKEYAESRGKYEEQAKAISYISSVYSMNKEYAKALAYARQAEIIQEIHHISETVKPVSLPRSYLPRLSQCGVSLTEIQDWLTEGSKDGLQAPIISPDKHHIAEKVLIYRGWG